MLYKKRIQRQMIKSALIIAFICAFSLSSTYFIYNQLKDARNEKVNSPNLETTFHEKEGDKISLFQFRPVTDSVGLSSKAYTFTVKNQTSHRVSYKIELIDDLEKRKSCGCENNQIPKELLKLSVRKDHQVAEAVLLSDFTNDILRMDSLGSNQEEHYTIRIWAVNSNFLLDAKAHYHGKIRVTEI